MTGYKDGNSFMRLDPLEAPCDRFRGGEDQSGQMRGRTSR